MQALNISETGRRAFAAGLKPRDNPFKIGSQYASLWARGYREARTEAEAAQSPEARAEMHGTDLDDEERAEQEHIAERVGRA